MIDQLSAEATECDFKVALETKKPKSWLKVLVHFLMALVELYFLVFQMIENQLDYQMCKVMLKQLVV